MGTNGLNYCLEQVQLVIIMQGGILYVSPTMHPAFSGTLKLIKEEVY